MRGETITTRFAPSPTGLLHLGNVRTALFNWLFARKEQGIFLLRIEDTDRARESDAALDTLLADLIWLGLQWDEGFSAGGTRGPYRQSERTALYAQYYHELQEQGLAYPCFCSPDKLALARKTQLAAGRAPRYPGTCARLTGEEVARFGAQGQQPSLRFRVSAGRTIEFGDLVRGPQSFCTDDIGDFVIRRSDGSAAFFFCNAIDDALMGVTHVVRGEDHLSNTPRQILILEALALRRPRYGHIALVLDEAGQPLSKRAGSLSVQSLRGRGYLPSAINNALARLGHTYEDPGYLDTEGLIGGFSLSRLSRAPARFSPAQLDFWQREVLHRAGAEELWNWMGEPARDLVPEAARQSFIKAIRANVLLPEDARAWASIIYRGPAEFSQAASQAIAEAKPGYFRGAAEALARHPDDFQGFIATLKANVAESGKRLFLPLRAALTGRVDGPELAAVYELLGAERMRARLQSHLG
ncbi:MAG: glutamate--tRNA ligase [Gammaproteobacteria bacterium]